MDSKSAYARNIPFAIRLRMYLTLHRSPRFSGQLNAADAIYS